MSAPLWNMFNWYWWLPDSSEEKSSEKPIEELEKKPVKRKRKASPKKDTKQKEEELARLEEELAKLEEESEKIEEKEIVEPPKPKRKRKTSTKKEVIPKDGIHLVLRPTILEELEKEAHGIDSTLSQLIELILEDHLKSKDDKPVQVQSWKCTFCEPEIEFKDYFEYSEHFFAQHMQPDLEKLSEVKQE